jgi:hypothetical protein
MLLRWSLPIADHRLIAAGLKDRVVKTSGDGMLVEFASAMGCLHDHPYWRAAASAQLSNSRVITQHHQLPG